MPSHCAHRAAVQPLGVVVLAGGLLVVLVLLMEVVDVDRPVVPSETVVDLVVVDVTSVVLEVLAGADVAELAGPVLPQPMRNEPMATSSYQKVLESPP